MKPSGEIAYPKLPNKIAAAGGDIRMVFRQKIVSDGDDCWANWDDATRTITVDTRALPAHQWRVLYHELAHATLKDSGLEELLADAAVEAICEAFATARIRERFG